MSFFKAGEFVPVGLLEHASGAEHPLAAADLNNRSYLFRIEISDLDTVRLLQIVSAFSYRFESVVLKTFLNNHYLEIKK